MRWLDQPEDHDFDAAHDYLSLVATGPVVARVVKALRATSTVRWKAKDILRASGLPELDQDNRHVIKDLHKIRAGEALSPVLLVRGDAMAGHPLIIADGYHRVCAVHVEDEDAEISCRMADLH